jgi:hypothetical protein
MSTEMIVGAVQKQFEATNAALNAARSENGEIAERAAEVEDAIIVFLDRPSTMRRVVDRVWETYRAGRIPNLLRVWHTVSVLFKLALRQAPPLRERIDRARQAGFKVERADEFEHAVRELEELRDQFCMTFPVATDEEAAADMAAIARGEYLDVDVAFAKIAGVDVETWRKRVEDDRRRQQS